MSACHLAGTRSTPPLAARRAEVIGINRCKFCSKMFRKPLYHWYIHCTCTLHQQHWHTAPILPVCLCPCLLLRLSFLQRAVYHTTASEVTIVCCPVQWGSITLSPRLLVSPLLAQVLHHWEVTTACCQVQSCHRQSQHSHPCQPPLHTGTAPLGGDPRLLPSAVVYRHPHPSPPSPPAFSPP